MNVPIQVTWRGRQYEIDLSGRTSSPTGFERVALWAPTAEGPLPRDRWIADVLVRGTTTFLEGKGDTAQEALDALAAQLPAPLAAGGSC
jgi:hypothetical protein